MNESDREPLVSICCLTYNHEKYIRDAIEGFLMQKTDFPFEILIHDDASTDGTADIIREYEAKYPDILKPIYQTENQYSKGIKVSQVYQFPRAKGKYIALCEGDDYWTDPYKLQKQVDFLEANPEYSMCFHNALIIYQGIKKRPSLFNKLNCTEDISLKHILDTWIAPTASIVFKKNNIFPMPKWTKSPKILNGDQVILLLSAKSGKIRYINECMSVYRQIFNGTSATSLYKNKFDELTQQLIFLYESFLQEVCGHDLLLLQKKIILLKKELKFYNLKRRSLILAMVAMPNFFSHKLLIKLKIKRN